MKRALIVFAKKPEAGKVKTRLVPPLTHEEAKKLYECLLKDSLIQFCRVCSRLDIRIFLTVTPEDACFEFEEFVQSIPEINSKKDEITIMKQSGIDLGEKMLNAFTYVFSQGYTHVVIIGTDHPTLPDDYLIQAFESMEQIRTDSVIGPSQDGGYYLLGLKEVRNDYFKKVQWSTTRVFGQTVENLRQEKKTVQSLPVWYDVDDIDSLNTLLDELARNEGSTIPAYSKQFLSKMHAIEV